MADIVTRLPGFLQPDAARTVLRPFIVEDPSTSDCPRTRRIIDGILALDDAELRDQLKVLAASLKNRHRDVDRLWLNAEFPADAKTLRHTLTARNVMDEY